MSNLSPNQTILGGRRRTIGKFSQFPTCEVISEGSKEIKKHKDDVALLPTLAQVIYKDNQNYICIKFQIETD